MANTLNSNKYLDLIGLAKFWNTAYSEISSSITAGDSAVNSAVTSALTSSVDGLQTKINENFKTVNSYTINSTAISTNPILTGQHIALGANVNNNNNSLGSAITLFEAITYLNESIVTNNNDITGKFNNHTHALNSAVVVGIRDNDTNFTGTLGTVDATNSTKVIKSYTGATKATINSTNVASYDHTHGYKQPEISSASFTGTLGTVAATNSTKVIKGYTGATKATINSTNVASNNHTHTYNHPKISSATFTGTLGTVAATNSTEKITYANGINAGTWPTFNSTNVASSDHTHSLDGVSVTGNITIGTINITTKDATVSTATTQKETVLNSVNATFSSASGFANVSKSNHTHNYNHSHTLSASFTGSKNNTEDKSFNIGNIVTYGTDATLYINLGGFTHNHSYTPTGSVAGTALELGTSGMMGASNSNVDVITGITVGSISTGTVEVPSFKHYHDIDNFVPAGSTTLNISGTIGTPSNTTSTLTGMNNTGAWPTLTTKEATIALGEHQHTYTPVGNINVTLSDENINTGTPSGTANIVSSITGDVVSGITTEEVTVALGEHQHTYTPVGNINVELTNKDKTTESPSGTAKVVSSIDDDIVSGITTEEVTVALGEHQHTYTPVGTIKVTPIIDDVITKTP